MHKNKLLFLTLFSLSTTSNLTPTVEKIRYMNELQKRENSAKYFLMFNATCASFWHAAYTNSKFLAHQKNNESALLELAFLNISRILTSIFTIYYGYDVLEWRRAYIEEEKREFREQANRTK